MIKNKNLKRFIVISLFVHLIFLLGLALVFKTEARVAISRIFEVTTIRLSSTKSADKQARTSKPETVKSTKSRLQAAEEIRENQTITKIQSTTDKSIKNRAEKIQTKQTHSANKQTTTNHKNVNKAPDESIITLNTITEDAYPDYSSNPKPHYPLIARRRGYEGTVVLNVLVLENGRVGKVAIEQSSKYKVLDSAAIRAVNDWNFIPGKRNGVMLASWVKVPIRFRLNDY
ncbi:MAG: TonB family protein [Candidatus Dadabacteria bacterium]|nr:TonB family protein [Candidatus Dadabacteria bacterium]